MTSISVVVPVLDGARHLGDLLAAVRREGAGTLEVLVVDSGSSDGSVGIARAAGAEVLEIPRGRFGHGRTRNLAAERTAGELICFLTQDATPLPGWLAAHREAFGLDDRVGAAFGPHLPRPDTSPMIARELTEFFARFSPDGRPAVQRAGGEPFLSNVNACYARACWEEIRFRDLPYAEDQAFGRDLLAAGWVKVFHPAAAVLHAHDYPPLEFMRRYFDEYRGLRQATGHVEPFSPRVAAAAVRAQVAADWRWMGDAGLPAASRAAWIPRALVHHSGRRAFAALGSRADRLPGRVRRALSLEGRDDADGAPARAAVAARRRVEAYHWVDRFQRRGPAPLRDPVPGLGDRERLHVAVVIPPFRRGSGGHNTIFQLVSRLERRGHTCSIWLDDFLGQHESEWPAVVRRAVLDHFAPVAAPVFKGFEQWYGADVALATGWQTVYPTMLLDGCGARAYLVNDHEPDFYPASAEREWAAASYRLGLHCIAASPWLRDLLRERYGASAGDFELAIDHDVYRPRPVARRRDTVVFYARSTTPRRAVPLGLLALAELRRRRPEVRIVLFGDPGPAATSFAHEHLGVIGAEQLSWLYSEATVGLCLSLTNLSLMPQEMLACGLPVVELAGISAESVFGAEPAVDLAAPEPEAIAGAVERLLDDRERWDERSRHGLALAARRTWERSAGQLEDGLRQALRAREG